MHRSLVLVAVLIVSFAAFASDPGEPLDCSDFIAGQPGIACFVLAEPSSMAVGRLQEPSAFDSLGRFLFATNGAQNTCGTLNTRSSEITAFDGAGVVGSWSDRCASTAPGQTDRIQVIAMGFNYIDGELWLSLRSWCECEGCQTCPEYPEPEVADFRWLAKLTGFPAAFDLTQFYEPTGTLSFTPALHPEGLPAADYFDTYYGDLATLGDFTQAQPLQCNYPDAIPQPGDYLAVADTTPTPPPGEGYYFVTAVNYQGQRRYGRQSVGGVLSGRDPELLPACATP